MSKLSTKALFLDRDGVINADTGYAYRPEHIVFMEGIFDLCRAAKSLHYLLIVTTNQAGIGRGYYTEEDFHALMDWIKKRFAEEGAPLDHIYFCPHHPQHGLGRYKQDCNDRKPKPGMIQRAQQEYNIDLNHSLLIGDKETDMQAALSAGVGMPLLFTQAPAQHYRTIPTLRDAIPFLR